MSQYINKIRTDQGDLQIDYNALANLPTISNPNLLINGDFQIWQRGESFSDIANKYTADRWMIKNAKSNTPLVEKSVATPTAEPVCQSMHIQDTADENTYLAYNFEHAIKGTYTLSFWYLSTTQISTYTHDNGSYVKLMDLAASSDWRRAHVSFHANAVDFINVIHAMKAGECYITGIKLEVGTTATPFVPRVYAEELLLCLRYYQTVNCRLTMTVYSTDRADGSYYFQVPMRGLPRTVTVNSMTYFDPTTEGFIESVDPVANLGHINNKYVLIRMDRNANDTFVIGQSRNALIDMSIDAEIY